MKPVMISMLMIMSKGLIWLYEVCKVCDVMKEGLSMYKMKCKWNEGYVQGVPTCTHTLTLK